MIKAIFYSKFDTQEGRLLRLVIIYTGIVKY